MNNELIDGLEPDTKMILDETRGAIVAILKNSKPRIHYLRLVMMNNIMRAFLTLYTLEDEYEQAQKALLKTLIDVEARKNRAWFTADKAVLVSTFELFDILLGSATDEQLNEIVRFVDENREAGKWRLYRNK